MAIAFDHAATGRSRKTISTDASGEPIASRQKGRYTSPRARDIGLFEECPWPRFRLWAPAEAEQFTGRHEKIKQRIGCETNERTLGLRRRTKVAFFLAHNDFAGTGPGSSAPKGRDFIRKDSAGVIDVMQPR